MDIAIIESIKALAELDGVTENEIKERVRSGCKSTERMMFILTCAAMASV